MIRLPIKASIKPNKYRNVKVEHAGLKFASKAELRRWLQLQILERAGEITELARQVPFEVAPAVVIDGKRKRAIWYIADAVYKDKAGTVIVEDVKGGAATPVYRLKKHLLALRGIHIKEVR